MKGKYIGTYALLLLSLIIFSSCSEKNDNVTDPLKQTLNKKPVGSVTVTVFATGLNNPRGLTFGPDGYLYVAEGGLGGTDSSTNCDQVIPPVGPYKGDFTATISKISPSGDVSIVAENLPSSQTSPQIGSLVSGIADVKFIGNTLYALTAGAGCSHGFPDFPNSILKIHSDGTWDRIADLSAYQQANPVKNPEPDDFEPDGTWYSMVVHNGYFYAVEPNHGEMVKVTTSGNISRVIDFSAFYGHIVPTAVAYHGNFYVGNLHPFPVEIGSSNIYKVTPSGQPVVWATGFTTVLGLVFDNQADMFVLEMSHANGDPTPNTGRIVKVLPSGTKQVLVDSLFFPTGMTMGSDGSLYVSNKGFGPPIPGFGEILKVTTH